MLETVLNTASQVADLASERSTSAPVTPRRGLGLGLRLGFLTTLVVAGVMAAVSGTQLAWELDTEWRERQTRLGESLHPVVMALRTAVTPEEARAAIWQFHSSYLEGSQRHHDLSVVDAAGRTMIETRRAGGSSGHPMLTATVSLLVPALGSDPVVLTVDEDSTDFSAVRTRRWWAWALHIGLTALLTLALLFVVIRREVTGPIDRLLGGIRKMERGYWDDMPDPGGAWEVRWLGWRFRALGQELSRTVEQLIAAQRRAYTVDGDAQADSQVPATESTLQTSVPSIHQDSGEAIRRLRLCLERLTRADAGDAGARLLAQTLWDHGTAEAERIGQPELRMALEDAALRVLDPDGFRDISRRINEARPRLEALARARGAQIRLALAARGVPINELCQRVKHPAGIWSKMGQKNLAFEQVHDLVALRIVLPTEADCYHALGVIHDLYVPIVGRFKDYIALPKDNGYRGLHASVRDANGLIFEVQIRSTSMHRHAEQGPAAHADYKDATWVPVGTGRVAPLRRLLGALGLPLICSERNCERII